MRISSVVEDLASDLKALGELGDQAMAEAARRLAGAMQAPLTARLLDVLGKAAAELQASLGDRRVEVRLVGDEAQIVVEHRPPEPPPLEEELAVGEGDAEARVTLRLPAQLKARVEAASARDGLSLNAYVVRALTRQVQGERTSVTVVRSGRRMSGYGRS